MLKGSFRKPKMMTARVLSWKPLFLKMVSALKTMMLMPTNSCKTIKPSEMRRGRYKSGDEKLPQENGNSFPRAL